jgi:hypothetical protein
VEGNERVLRRNEEDFRFSASSLSSFHKKKMKVKKKRSKVKVEIKIEIRKKNPKESYNESIVIYINFEEGAEKNRFQTRFSSSMTIYHPFLTIYLFDSYYYSRVTRSKIIILLVLETFF